jgi:hypothetical protein
MSPSLLEIDQYLFNHQYKRFMQHVQKHSGVPFVSFNANPYTEREEGYKYQLLLDARRALDVDSWKLEEIGSGRIVRATVSAIELKGNNLVAWEARWGPKSRSHRALLNAIRDPERRLVDIERALYALYCQEDDAVAFATLTELLGQQYRLISYLFYLKDRSRYLPLAPAKFDEVFRLFDVPLVTSRSCSWESYGQFLGVVLNARELLSARLEGEVTLLDAHSFLWMLVNQIPAKADDSLINEYTRLPFKDREAIQKARIGQGRFRNQLIRYWSTCAVTGCTETALLKASHIKPWSECAAAEALDPYNGLLLTPSLDCLVDSGYVSFDCSGAILISPCLSASDARILGVTPSSKLRHLDSRHEKFLRYHREKLFKSSSPQHVL